MNGENTEHTVEMKERQFQFLTDMAQKFHLPDESKALRCLLDYAIQNSSRHDEIFAALRCLDC